MYKLEYLHIARQDMIDIVSYISKELKNPSAAERLAVDLVEAANGLLAFPYANPVYIPIRPLKHEYRNVLVRNFLMFYWIEEERKTITISRVLYARRNHAQWLD